LKLGCRCSHGTVRNVLRHRGLLPALRRGQRSWRELVRQQAEQMLAVDFFTVETVWLQRLHVPFFLQIGSRCVHLAGCTASPTGAWVVQQARQLGWLLQDGRLVASLLAEEYLVPGAYYAGRVEDAEILVRSSFSPPTRSNDADS
jgi:hypothetical protein